MKKNLNSGKPKRVTFNSFNTRKNLPEFTSNKRGEANFLGKFERAYFETVKSKEITIATGREFALSGYGRADILWIGIKKGSGFHAMSVENRINLTAIEGKLTDWRKGLLQASQYRYFANRSILVLPPKALRNAINHLETFRDLKIGLWEFEPETSKIIKHTTPRISKPLNQTAYSKAISSLQNVLSRFKVPQEM